jgi:hypothetical protein
LAYDGSAEQPRENIVGSFVSIWPSLGSDDIKKKASENRVSNKARR